MKMKKKVLQTGGEVGTATNQISETPTDKALFTVPTSEAKNNIGKKCVINAGGKFDGQQASIKSYDRKTDEYQVISEGAELWFRLEQLQILNE
jgi:hypothetical protein